MPTRAENDAKLAAIIRALEHDKDLTNVQIKQRLSASARVIRRARANADVPQPEPDRFSVRLRYIKTPDRYSPNIRPRM